jgi:hypothetical protein
MQASSAPSTPRIFSFVNTAGAVPGKASVARNIARSYSLSDRGLVIVDICLSKRFETAKTQEKLRLVIMRFLPRRGDRITKGRTAAALSDTVIRDQ